MFPEVEVYLNLLHYTDKYKELPLEDRQRIVFTAEETLKYHYDDMLVTFKAVALQTLYMIEGEGEDFSMLKRQGVKSLGLDGMNLSFDLSTISPDVIALIEKGKSKVPGGSSRSLVG